MKAVVNVADIAGVAEEFVEKRVKASCFLVAANGKARDSVVTGTFSGARKNQADLDSGDVKPRFKNEFSERAAVTADTFCRIAPVVHCDMQENFGTRSKY